MKSNFEVPRLKPGTFWLTCYWSALPPCYITDDLCTHIHSISGPGLAGLPNSNFYLFNWDYIFDPKFQFSLTKNDFASKDVNNFNINLFFLILCLILRRRLAPSVETLSLPPSSTLISFPLKSHFPKKYLKYLKFHNIFTIEIKEFLHTGSLSVSNLAVKNGFFVKIDGHIRETGFKNNRFFIDNKFSE